MKKTKSLATVEKLCFNKIKDKQGITLVALIVTIIILLILAGISIASLTGNGLFEKAKLAKKEYQNSKDTEQNKLDEYEKIISSFRNELTNKNSISDTDLINWLNKIDIELNVHYIVNHSLLETLMNSRNAVDYMISNENIMNEVINSEYALKYLVQSDYALYKLMINDTYRLSILNSSYAYLIDENATTVPIGTTENIIDSGDYYNSNYYGYKAFDNWTYDTYYNSANDSKVPKYIGYDFKEDVIIYKVKAAIRADTTNTKILLQGGKLDNSWNTITNLTLSNPDSNYDVKEYLINNNNIYQKYRLFADNISQLNSYGGIAMQILQFYCIKVPENI